MKRLDVQKIIRDSLELDEHDALSEAYVAQPKSYDLNTELLLSKTKEAHKELYNKYIESLNHTSAQLDVVDRRLADSNVSDYRSVKVHEQYNLNAVYLHELYFANISDPYSEISVDSLSHMRLNKDFGTFDDWQMDFRACAMAAQSGWAVCVYSMYLKRFVNMIVDGHNQQALVGTYPVVVLDMWEHARRDYLNHKSDYIRAMMKELNWNVIEERFKRCDYIAQALSAGGKETWA